MTQFETDEQESSIFREEEEEEKKKTNKKQKSGETFMQYCIWNKTVEMVLSSPLKFIHSPALSTPGESRACILSSL